MKPAVKKLTIPGLSEAPKAWVRFVGDSAELLCSGCGGGLWEDSALTVKTAGRSDEDVVNDLVQSWGECNGSAGDIHCEKCRTEVTGRGRSVSTPQESVAVVLKEVRWMVAAFRIDAEGRMHMDRSWSSQFGADRYHEALTLLRHDLEKETGKSVLLPPV